MARDLHPDVKTASLGAVKHIALLMEADFDSAPVRLFTGTGTITIDGVDYLGSGKLISMSPAQETAEIQATNATIQLSGVQQADIAVALTEKYRGRACRLKLAFFTDAGVLIGEPVPIFSGRMDVMTDNGDTANPIITMTAENDLVRLSVAKHRNRTHEDQQIDYPGDRGLEFVPAMQNKTLYV
ncbi:MAG: hypothetical protein ACAH80_18600 [Alphaproteobacteria bacterium]